MQELIRNDTFHILADPVTGETAVSKADSEPRYIHLTDRGFLTFFGDPASP